MDQPSHQHQVIAALDAARHMAAHIPPEDFPRAIETTTHSAIPAVGLDDVVGVILHGCRDLQVLERYKTLFGGQIVRSQQASTRTWEQYTEHRLVGSVCGVPYVTWIHTNHERIPLPRRERPKPADTTKAAVPPGPSVTDDAPADAATPTPPADADQQPADDAAQTAGA